jgi:ribonuclease HII
MPTILGIDEAGRGSVIGPLVVGGVMIDEEDEHLLAKIGVRDSKELTPAQRERMAVQIKKVAKDWVTVRVTAKEIDEMRKKKNLNIIEAEKMAEIIKLMKADKAYVDAPQVSTEKFKNVLLALAKNHTHIIAENYADKTYKTVSAASIIAKVDRDAEVERIKKEVGFDFGVGYSHDARSIEFIKKCLREKTFLEYLRHSWTTVQELKGKRKQKKLGDY